RRAAPRAEPRRGPRQPFANVPRGHSGAGWWLNLCSRLRRRLSGHGERFASLSRVLALREECVQVDIRENASSDCSGSSAGTTPGHTSKCIVIALARVQVEGAATGIKYDASLRRWIHSERIACEVGTVAVSAGRHLNLGD